jgi:hypothetical protein
MLTFEEVRMASLLSTRMEQLDSGAISPGDLPIDTAESADLAELLDIAFLLRMRGRGRRSLG